MRRLPLAGVAALTMVLSAVVGAQAHDPSMHRHDQMMSHDGRAHVNAAAKSQDVRQAVHFPQELREHTLSNMRDHLLSMQQIQEALSTQDFDKAADIAEQRLGMSSLKLHGAHEVAKYMPKGMQDAGSAMHHSASQFAIAAQEASATGDVKPTVAALSRVTATCVACHAGYRLE